MSYVNAFDQMPQWAESERLEMGEYPAKLKVLMTCPCLPFYKLLRHMFGFVYIFDRCYKTLYANRVSGGEDDEILGKHINLRFQIADRARVLMFMEEAWKKSEIVFIETKDLYGEDLDCKFVPISGKLAMALTRVVSRKHLLTAREKEIHELVKHGLSSKQIAERLHIAVSSVSGHRKNIARKI